MNLDGFPSLKKMQTDLKAMKVLTLLNRTKRKEIEKIETNFNDLINQFTSFNNRFSDLGWCAYDSMNTTLIKEVNQIFDEKGIEKAESKLIEYYHTDVKKIIHWLKNKSEEFSIRYDLFLKAFNDHLDGNYHSSVPIFLMIADGVINDYTRKSGFWSGQTNLSAWDCLVGSSKGLEKLKDIFNKSIRKTITEPITLPYRNGILHGRCTDYANPQVSSKSLALLFVIADWISMSKSEEYRKVKLNKELNPPTIRESLKKSLKIKKIGKKFLNGHLNYLK